MLEEVTFKILEHFDVDFPARYGVFHSLRYGSHEKFYTESYLEDNFYWQISFFVSPPQANLSQYCFLSVTTDLHDKICGPSLGKSCSLYHIVIFNAKNIGEPMFLVTNNRQYTETEGLCREAIKREKLPSKSKNGEAPFWKRLHLSSWNVLVPVKSWIEDSSKMRK
ncbi:hypothetical protein CAEBREN_23156 [Caenorhabditis brenneri]|uniref:Uncharacterized protein n=1 Tax=Caenorhabditis brenneri TaxID=135651 RepID=G0MW91_CAEBE|nr:hypothetical protein CAEBREN_23156 [Caenorhabditis brenneri]